MPSTPIMHLIAGVNGSGKTTFYEQYLSALTPGAEFVNADEIARQLWPEDVAAHNVESARLAANRRLELIDARSTFVAETVFSHESKLELIGHAKERDFRVILYHIGISSEKLARARVATRVEIGGHDVPPERVSARYERCQILIPMAAAVADRAFVFDNSGGADQRTHTHVMTMLGGRIVKIADVVPTWVEEAYSDALFSYRSA